MKKSRIVAFAFLSSLFTTACGSGSSIESELTQYSNMSLDSFDTVFVYSEYSSNKDEFDAHFKTASELFKHYNDLFDIYNDYSGINNIKTINDNAGGAPVTVDKAIIELLSEAKQFYSLSGGEFDITCGSLLRVWHNYREEGIALNEKGEKGKLPSIEELTEASTHKGWDSVEIDEDAQTVCITDPDVSLDVGGIAKGFAVEKIADALESEGVQHAVINAGGNNRTIGSKPNGTAWNIGIQNPDGEGSLFIVSLSGSISAVTSGDYERYYEAEDGKRYSHIIDPSTLYPATYFRSVTILTSDSGIGDCLSTSLFTMSYEDGLKLVENYKKAHPDESLEVCWIMDADKAVQAEHMKETGGYVVAYTQGLADSITWQ